ncbi:MAG: hypothetical protein L6R39_003066 [Caloplaca ligustica]|nr:MAG: hypothetical protein L6R39_003066 [Caloplaca ligustica]
MADVYNSQLVLDTAPPFAIHLADGLQDAFDLYHQVQESHGVKSVLGGPALPALGHAVAGSTGAAISNFVVYPLALIVTRLQIQRALRNKDLSGAEEGYQSVQDAARKIYEHENGLAGFYAGITSDTAKTVADSFLYFFAYNLLRQTRLRAQGGASKHLPVTEELGVGLLAGAFTKLWTTPIANIVTRQQAASMLSRNQQRNGDKASIRQIALQIREEKGLQGFWSGYSASLVLTLNPSLTFFLFETLKRLFVPRQKRSDPPPQATFLIAAVSKAIASAITYPCSLAKSRAQSSTSTSVKEKGATEAHGTSGEGEKEETSVVQQPRAKAPTNVFSTILHIAKTEGLGALYEGLGAEVLKGFFSHGLTMIVKQAVHGIIIQLYYATLKLLKRFPGPEAAVRDVKEKADEVVTGAGQRLRLS